MDVSSTRLGIPNFLTDLGMIGIKDENYKLTNTTGNERESCGKAFIINNCMNIEAISF